MKNIMFILTFSVSSIILFANPWDGKDPYNIIVEGINSTYPDGVEYTSKYEEDDVRREDREIGQAEGAPAFIYDYKGKVVVQTTATYRYDLILCSDDEIIHYNTIEDINVVPIANGEKESSKIIYHPSSGDGDYYSTEVNSIVYVQEGAQ